MISFRLTAEEYDRVRELCEAYGTRSISELARNAINALLNQPVPIPRQSLEHEVAKLEGQVSMLLVEFERMREKSAVKDEIAADLANH